MNGVSEPEFEKAADVELHRLVEALDEVGDAIDAELQMGVLNIVFESGTKFVVNSHRAARQIWMAADRRAWHFDLRDGRWLTSPEDQELWHELSAVLSSELGRTVQLVR
ncbi:MAG: iron donor protein CyaY [Myxococcota bacterium]